MAETLDTSKKQRNSKHSRTPRDRRRIDPDGKVLHQILLQLNPEGDTPALPTRWLPPLIDADEKWVRQLACDAACRPYEYTGRRDPFMKASIIWRMPAGEKLLVEKGYIEEAAVSRGDPLEHRVQDSTNFAQFLIGVRKYPDLELYNWERILQHPKTPIETKRSLTPFRIPISNGKFVVPDGRPFVLWHNTEGMLGLFKETDRGTEDTGGKAHVTYEKKIAAWKEIFTTRDLIWKTYGFQRAMLLFITTSPEKEAVIQRVIKRVIGDCPYILIQHTEDFYNSPKSLHPHTKLIDEPWHRVGYPDFDLKTLRDVA
jgi:hypothetical protein